MSFNLIKEGMELSLKRGVRTKFGIQQLVEYETEVYRPLMGSSLRNISWERSMDKSKAC